MFLAGREPDDVAGMDGLDGAAPALGEAGAGGDDERLAEGVGVPGGAGAGLKGDARALAAGGCRGLEEGIDPDAAGEVVGRAFGRGAGTVSLNIHREMARYRARCWRARKVGFLPGGEACFGAGIFASGALVPAVLAGGGAAIDAILAVFKGIVTRRFRGGAGWEEERGCE